MRRDLLKPSVPTMPFNAPLTSSSRFSTRPASAASVWRRTTDATGRSLTSAVAASTAVVMDSMLVMKLVAAVAFCAVVELELMPAAVSSNEG